jgi:hypothetical protein
MPIKRKILIFILSFAIGNIALYSIINFHQYRITGVQLAKFDDYFIKKEEKYFDLLSYSTDLSQILICIDLIPPMGALVIQRMRALDLFHSPALFSNPIWLKPRLNIPLPIRGSPSC